MFCLIEGCGRKSHARGLCGMHHQQKRKDGTLRLYGKTRKPGAPRKEYNCWLKMKQRCLDPSHEDFEYYGGRGIKVHPVWIASFPAFISDVGPAPSRVHTIERVDVNGNYEPGNVRWATRKEQAHNRRDNVKAALDGEIVVVAKAADECGADRDIVRGRIRRGWDLQSALIVPRLRTRRA